MPEAPSTHEVSVEIPAVMDAPIHKGESQASVNLQHQQARAAEMKELREKLNRLEGTYQPTFNPKDAKSSSRRRRVLLEKWEELKSGTFYNEATEQWMGPCPPATVINFNPIALHLDGELQRWSIPAARGKLGKPIDLSYNGRTFRGAYMTVMDPHVWPVITDVHDGPTEPITSIEARYIPPVGLAHQFYEHYVTGASDAQNMGGVLIFQGDIRTIEKKRLERADGKILFPRAHIMLDGSGRVNYASEWQPFQACVADCFERQRNYANAQIAEGHSFASSSSDIIRNQLSNYHIMWHNWSLDMKYKEEAEKWASERLTDGPGIKAVRCPDCKERQDSPDQFFCSNCNAPFDACKAFLAGKPVSADRLESYPADSEEFRLILAEATRRASNRALLNLGDIEPAKSKRGKKSQRPEVTE